MNRLNKQKLKKAKINEYLFPLEIQEKRVNDSYIYIPIKSKHHISQTKRLITKTIQNHFRNADNDEMAMQKKRSDKYLQMKSSFDAYMNLTPSERRKVSINNMRGYQYDINARLLYSFEDNCIYKVTEDPIYNKICITRKENIPFTDIQKRAVFDSPTKYKPISPYRIKWPSTPIDIAGNEIVIKMDDQFNNLSASLENASESFNQASANINNLAQQFNNIIAPQQNIKMNKEEEVDDNKVTTGYLHYREDGLRPIGNNMKNILNVKYKSKKYDSLINKGYIHENNYLYRPEAEEQNQQVIATQNIQQQIIPTEIIDRFDALITKLDQNTFVNSLGNIMNTLVQIEKNFNVTCNNLRETIDNQVVSLDAYFKEFVKSYIAIQDRNEKNEKDISTIQDRNEKYEKDISTIVNSIKTLATSINNHFDTFANKLETLDLKVKIPPVKIEQSGQITSDKILEEFSKKYQDIIKQQQDIYKDLLTNIKTEMQNYENTQLSTITKRLEETVTHITQNQQTFNTTINNITSTITNETEAIRHQMNENALGLANTVTEQNELTRQSNYDNAFNLAHVVHQSNENINNNMIGGIDYISRMMMNQQQFTQKLLTDGFENLNNYADQIFNSYRLLLDKPIINMTIQNVLPPKLIEDINYISALSPQYNSLQIGDADYSLMLNNPQSIQRDIYIFAENLQPRVNDESFKQFTQQVGFTTLFNAFRIRGIDPIINQFFSSVSNPNIRIHSEQVDAFLERIRNYNINNNNNNYNKLIESFMTNVGLLEDIPDANSAMTVYNPPEENN